MKRSLTILVAVFATASLGASLTSCNTPSCGMGTVQKQQSDGSLKCVAVDVQAAQTPCDTDGGNVTIVGGKCVSAIQCDPGTTMNENGICVGSGSTGKPTCSTPSAGNTCVFGDIFDFTTNTPSATTPIHVELYNPTDLLNGGAPLASQDVTGGAYAFQSFKAPMLGLIVIMTGRTNTGVLVPAATGDQGISAGIYHVDAYALKQADVANWGFDITAGGAVIAKFYNDPKPAANALIINETHPVAGVTLRKDFQAATGAQYFNDTLTKIDTNLMVTGNSGTAIVASPVPMGSNFPVFDGTGPTSMPITWEMDPGGSAAGLVLITRFHPN